MGKFLAGSVGFNCPVNRLWNLLSMSLCSLVHIDIQSTSSWSSLGALQDPEVKDLAEFLIGTVLKSKAESTTKVRSTYMHLNDGGSGKE